jgi:hypothetical protein
VHKIDYPQGYESREDLDKWFSLLREHVGNADNFERVVFHLIETVEHKRNSPHERVNPPAQEHLRAVAVNILSKPRKIRDYLPMTCPECGGTLYWCYFGDYANVTCVTSKGHGCKLKFYGRMDLDPFRDEKELAHGQHA